MTGARTLAVVVGDFGRDATLRFLQAVSRQERARITERLPAGVPFFDEHRQMTLAVTGDLPFVKAPALDDVDWATTVFDERVLVGFPGGPTALDVAPRLGALALEAMVGPALRSEGPVLLLIPCNTLAPASWWIANQLTLPEAAVAMFRAGGGSTRLLPVIEEVASALAPRVRTITPPEGALREAHRLGATSVTPLGTDHIDEIYREAADRMSHLVAVESPRQEWRAVASEAIVAAIDGDDTQRRRSAERLEGVARQARRAHGEGHLIIEACTDLDYGVGLDSNDAYAREVVRAIYDPTS